MVKKCANPGCSSKFRYFHLGKLFVMKSGERHKLDYYWLCERCCDTLTIEQGSGKGIMVRTAMVKRT